MNPRNIAVAVVLIGLVLLIALSRGPGSEDGDDYDPTGTSPQAAKALVLLLEDFGADVKLDPRLDLTDVDTAVILDDRMAEDVRTALEQWVIGGGRLVVADPLSPFFSAASFPLAVGMVKVRTCSTPQLRDVGDLVVGRYTEVDASATGVECTTERDEIVVGEQPIGDGSVVMVGVRSAFTNGRLDEADNAVLAVGLLAPQPGETVAFVGRAQLIDAGGLRALVADRVWIALFVLAAAIVVFLVAVGRRLGRPVTEEREVPIEGAELVVATGRLLERNDAPAAAASRVRTQFRSEVGSLVGAPGDANAHQFAAAVSEHTGADAADVVDMIERPVASDEQLVNVAADIQRLAGRLREDELRSEGGDT